LRRAAAALPAALLLAGCGIQQSEVVDAGTPATLLAHPGVSDGTLLFFRSNDGRLVPVPRALPAGRVTDSTPPDAAVETALNLLLAGPGPEETAAGIGTSLPATGGAVGVLFSPHEIRVSLSVALAGLDGTALDQLVCTAAYAVKGREQQLTVRLSGRDGRTKTGTCDVEGDTIPPPSTTTAATPPPASPDDRGTSAGRIGPEDPVTGRADR
ncbi:hypothetical protein GTY41_18070, partial [Streptomyces sp. SID685]|uniref:hypothetical protein n=1 Tax=Streptomyces sp. SID685 TaxID=2690322 RepID=UPI00136E9154